MKKYIIALTAIGALLFSSCTNLLDIPQKGVVAYETYYTSDEAPTSMATSPSVSLPALRWKFPASVTPPVAWRPPTA